MKVELVRGQEGKMEQYSLGLTDNGWKQIM
jgi:hypothetical protein